MKCSVQSFLLAADLRKAVRLPLSVTLRNVLSCGGLPVVLRVSDWLQLVKGVPV